MTETRVALAGDDGTLREAVEAAGATVVPADADPGPDAVVALGERALADTALGDPPAPVLPVGAREGLHAVTKADVRAALARTVAGEAVPVEHATLGVEMDGEFSGRALFDATLMTAEQARISEYAVSDAGGVVDRFRADGVVVATPAGSGGYARAAGGSILAPGTGLSVVPVSTFETKSDTWVVDREVTVRVERDDCDVELVLDGEVATEVPHEVDVRVGVDEYVTLLRVPEDDPAR